MTDSDYKIHKDRDSGLHLVYFRGVKIGQTQTEAAARLIRRNHKRHQTTQTTQTAKGE